jgi:hypothetical protein
VPATSAPLLRAFSFYLFYFSLSYFNGLDGVMLVAPAVVATIVEKRAILPLNAIVTGKRLTANAIHRADKRNLVGFLLDKAKASFLVAVIVASESAIGLLNGEHIKQASRGMNLECSPVMRSRAVALMRCAKLDEVLWVSHSMKWDGVYWDHVDNLF